MHRTASCGCCYGRSRAWKSVYMSDCCELKFFHRHCVCSLRWRPATIVTWSASWTTAAATRPVAIEARIRRAFEKPRDEWKIIRQNIIKSPLREFRCDTEAAIAFVQVAGAFYIFIIHDI